ncbi:MAG: hypothetical protein AABX11_04875 [Nanoarchaeota archaeon]
MKKINVWREVIPPLELHEDYRGKIADIFYNQNIQHVSIISSKKGALRGDHYHKNTTQHMLITKGALEYWYKPFDSNEPAKMILLKTGDLVSTPPNEIHALRIVEENEFVVFTQGIRGGKDYEADTYRITQTIIPKDKINESKEFLKE